MTYNAQHNDAVLSQPGPAEYLGTSDAISFKIPRPGARPITFVGSELAMAMSFTPEIPFWYELNIYRTVEQKFVLAVRLFYQSSDIPDRVEGWTFDTLPEVFDAIEAYDAAKDVRPDFSEMKIGASAEMAAWAMEVRARIAFQRANFASLVGELFEELESAGVYKT